MPLPHALLIAAASVLLAAPVAMAQARPDAKTIAALAPTGRLRAAINLGNPVLAQKDGKTGELTGVSVRLAKALAQELKVPLDLVPFESAGTAADAAPTGVWDVAFLASDPGRADRVSFTSPYVVIVGTYLVKADSQFHAVADLDKDGLRLSVGKGAAYDLFLTRAIKHATLVRVPTSAGAIDEFLAGKDLDAAAGVGAVLASAAKGRSDLRVIAPGFQEINQAMAVPKQREASLAYVQGFVERMKASGFVRQALDDTGQGDAQVAPPAAR